MKRSLSSGSDHDDRHIYATSIPQNIEIPPPSEIKRARSGSPSRIVGPLVFNGSETKLERALLAVEPSSLPGVHRMTPQTNSSVRVWAPNIPVTQFLEVSVSEMLHAIDGKCIFIFDPRNSESDIGICATDRAPTLFQNEAIKRYGLMVSQYPPPPLNEGFAQAYIPVVQDPSNILGTLCNFSSYLGASAVLVKNNEVKATCMLSRSPQAIDTALSEWLNV